MRTYSELIQLPTFEERFGYLKLDSSVGSETFGTDRYLNQVLYTSKEWKSLRDKIFIRDGGCDLASPDRAIYGRYLIHHMNPITIEDIVNRRDFIFDPEFLITTTHKTHNAIHYSDDSLITSNIVVDRKPGDTKLW